MIFIIITFLAGMLTIATPCIVPVLPFILSRAGGSFRHRGLPLLLGLAITFAVVASLASVAGGWAVAANRYGRTIALAVMTLFGLTMLLPGLAARLTMPVVSLGARLAGQANAQGGSVVSSLLAGVATGLVWAPCAGPVLGLILRGAALRGPGLETSLLLLTYGLGAATALAAGMFAGGRLLAVLKRSVRWGEGLRRLGGAAVIAGAAMIWLGLDTGLLTRWSSATVTAIEQNLLAEPQPEPALIIPSAHAEPAAIPILAERNRLCVMAGLAPAMTMNGTFVPHHALILTPMGTSSDMTIMQRNGAKMTPAAEPAPALSAPLVALLGTRQWLNTPPLRPDDLRGKVVVVNFWTYSCINCLRALPHVRAWARTYGDRGLLVVGVHTPEFAFEKDAGNVRQALAALGVTYPVAIDSDFRIWRAFGNQAWPALYVIGADGRVRHRVLGEGGYDQSERLIRQLLSEAAAAPVSEPLASVAAPGAQAASDAPNLGSGETYIGYAQTTGFASFGGIRQDVPALYRIVPPLAINRWGLAGTWTVGGEFATSNAPAGRIAYRFHARDLHLVLAPAVPNQTMRFRVTLDGAPPGADHGADVDPAGWGSVQDGRLYQLIRQTGPITDRTFEIEFFDAGVRAYAFTFG